jgi:hypothetical protein
MALPRSNNEITESFGSTVPWWPRIRCSRVRSSAVFRLTCRLDRCLSAARSQYLHEKYVRELGRNVRIQGLHPVRGYPNVMQQVADYAPQWESRLLPLDPVTVAHVLKNSTIYEKPLLSRRIIERLIGRGMFAAEGHVHKRQRRVATPAFSVQNMRALVPLVFNKGEELKDRWMGLIQEQAIHNSQANQIGICLDVCHWMSRATFDVIGLAGWSLLLLTILQPMTPLMLYSGFDYHFNAIQNEDNELFNAYKNMFEIALSQSQNLRKALNAYFPILERFFVRFCSLGHSGIPNSAIAGRGDECRA